MITHLPSQALRSNSWCFAGLTGISDKKTTGNLSHTPLTVALHADDLQVSAKVAVGKEQHKEQSEFELHARNARGMTFASMNDLDCGRHKNNDEQEQNMGSFVCHELDLFQPPAPEWIWNVV